MQQKHIGYRVDFYLTSGPTLFAVTKKKDQAQKLVNTWRSNRHKDEVMAVGDVEMRTDHVIATVINPLVKKPDVQPNQKGTGQKPQASVQKRK